MNIDPTILPALTAIIASAVTSLFALLGVSASNRHAMRQLREQWKREDEKAQRAAEEQLRQAELVARAQERQQLKEMYSTCIARLGDVLFHAFYLGQHKRDENNRIIEAQKWASLLLVLHYDKDSGDYKSFVLHYETSLRNSQPDADSLHNMRLLAIKFATEDPRLK